MEEITKHTRKIIKAGHNPTSSLSKKILEILLEIFIIVFAISLSQFLERQRDENIKQKEVKEFLIGLKHDMLFDVEQAKENVQNYNRLKPVFIYLGNIKVNEKPNPDTLNGFIKRMSNNGYLRPNISIFEGFKSSGKLEEIEDKALLHNILYYYEQAIPQLTQSTEPSWLGAQNKLNSIFVENRVDYENGSNNNLQLITRPQAKNLCKILIPWPIIFTRYNKIITLANTIISQIDKNYATPD